MTASKHTKTILILTDGNIDHASSRIRAIQYIPYLQEQKWEVQWIPRIPSRAYPRIRFAFIKRWQYLRLLIVLLLNRYDIIFIQRRFMGYLLRVLIRSSSNKVVFDLDDAIFLNDNGDGLKLIFEKTIKLADQIIVSTPELVNFLKKINRESQLIYSSVDARLIQRKSDYENSNNEPLTLVWIGSEWTSHYLYKLAEPLKMAAKKVNLRLKVIGVSPEFKLEGIDIDKIPWFEGVESDLLAEADIGIMPLTNGEWERYKGGYKLFLYMAAGLPLLASPVGINKQIIKKGKNGYLPESNEHWKDKIVLLANNSSLRHKLGTQAYEDLIQKYDYKVNAKKLVELLECAN